MLEKKVVIDKIEILEDGQIQVRQAIKILEDGNELSKTYHRWVLVPGDDISKQTNKIKTVANAVWTQEVKDKYKVNLDKNK